MGQQQRAPATRLADHVDRVNVDVLHAVDHLREAVQVRLGGARVEAVHPVGA